MGALLVAMMSMARPAAADETQTARQHYARGTKLYDLGRYLEAAKEYEATYELKDDPAILFNIGQAYRLGHAYADGIRAYKSFLRRSPEAPQRALVEGYIRDMQTALDKEPKPQPPPQPPPAATTPAPETPAAATPPPTATTTSERRETPVYKKWWLWTIVGGVVVAGVVVGVTVGVLSSNDSFQPSLGKVGPSALTVRF
jgi:tetratricopeptide (TPR) repeat protein